MRCPYERMLTNKPEHLRTFDYLGPHRYFLTFCTYRRHRAFITHARVQIVRTQILRASHDGQFALIAYCFMPDHLHLLIEGQTDASDCRRFISRTKQFSGFHYQKAFGARLWQRYGFERVLRNDEATLSVARYIVENPVRAGLVHSVDAYPFVGSSDHAVAEILEAVQMSRTWRSG
jgi:putative transposase